MTLSPYVCQSRIHIVGVLHTLIVCFMWIALQNLRICYLTLFVIPNNLTFEHCMHDHYLLPVLES